MFACVEHRELITSRDIPAHSSPPHTPPTAHTPPPHTPPTTPTSHRTHINMFPMQSKQFCPTLIPEAPASTPCGDARARRGQIPSTRLLVSHVCSGFRYAEPREPSCRASAFQPPQPGASSPSGAPQAFRSPGKHPLAPKPFRACCRVGWEAVGREEQRSSGLPEPGLLLGPLPTAPHPQPWLQAWQPPIPPLHTLTTAKKAGGGPTKAQPPKYTWGLRDPGRPESLWASVSPRKTDPESRGIFDDGGGIRRVCASRTSWQAVGVLGRQPPVPRLWRRRPDGGGRPGAPGE